jgi:hypothetical protein
MIDALPLDAGGRRLRAALAAVLIRTCEPELRLVHDWLDSWSGVGLIAVGTHRRGWDLQLTQYGDGNWRATFYVTGVAHSIVAGSAWEPTAWGAVQRVVSQFVETLPYSERHGSRFRHQ